MQLDDVCAYVVSVHFFCPGRKTITGSFIGSVKETEEMLDFCKDKGLTSEIEVVKMDYINKALERLEKNDVRYRFVVDVAGSKLEGWFVGKGMSTFLGFNLFAWLVSEGLIASVLRLSLCWPIPQYGPRDKAVWALTKKQMNIQTCHSPLTFDPNFSAYHLPSSLRRRFHFQSNFRPNQSNKE